jgi:hypothetical protein
VFPVRYGLDFYVLCRRNSVFKGLIKHQSKKTYCGVNVLLHHSSNGQYVEVSGQLHTTVALRPGKQATATTG